jgi:hypothetical protein
MFRDERYGILPVQSVIYNYVLKIFEVGSYLCVESRREIVQNVSQCCILVVNPLTCRNLSTAHTASYIIICIV